MVHRRVKCNPKDWGTHNTNIRKGINNIWAKVFIKNCDT